MRILHLSDLHFHQRWLEWLAQNGRSFDVCCVTGDWLNRTPNFPIKPNDQIAVLRRWLGAFPGKLFTCTGEHDFWPPAGRDPYAWGRWLKQSKRAGIAVDGDVERLGGYTFSCRKWTHSVDPFVVGPVIALIHAPPGNTPVGMGRGPEVGDAIVLEDVRTLPRGSFVLSGHVHEPRRWWCRIQTVWCFNPGAGASEDPEPNHIVIDTRRRTAVLHSRGAASEPVKLLW